MQYSKFIDCPGNINYLNILVGVGALFDATSQSSS